MKELVVISGKGGTGKTSVLGALASLAENAVLADCDVDAANLHLLLQPDIQQKKNFTGGKIARIDPDKCTSCGLCQKVCRFDAITPDYNVDDIACEGCGVCVWTCPEQAISFEDHVNGEWFISKTRFGDMVHARLGIAEENSGKLVTLVRKEAKKLAEEHNRALLLVDGPPGTGCPVIAAIGGADVVLIVAEPTLSAIHDMQRVIKLARFFDVPAVVAINKSDLNAELTDQIKSFCQLEKITVVGQIPYDLDMVRAQINGQTIMEFDNKILQNHVRELWDFLQKNLIN